MVQEVNAVVLSGGSPFGLDAASGRSAGSRNTASAGRPEPVRVPIVTGRDPVRPRRSATTPRFDPERTADTRRWSGASDGPVAEGSIGAGAGATVGKLAGAGRAMKGGIGTASIALPERSGRGGHRRGQRRGRHDRSGDGRGGGRDPQRRRNLCTDARKLILTRTGLVGASGENTTIGVVATNATLTKAQATKLAQMAHDGLARTIYPAHTPWDGDTIFSLATGEVEGEADLIVLGAVAADVVAEAILDAVRSATGLDGLPSVNEFSGLR